MENSRNQEEKRRWEKRLIESGLPSEQAINKVEMVPVEAISVLSNESQEKALDDELGAILENYEGLDPRIQADIVIDLRKKRSDGCSFQEIIDRLDLLAEKGYELMKLSDDSDETYKPKPSNKKEYESAEKEKAKERIRELIEKLEKIQKKKEHNPGGFIN